MKRKYSLLLDLKSFNYEISLLKDYSNEHADCYELLQLKLDTLCQYIMNEQHHESWEQWGHNEEIIHQSEKLRSTSNQALCELEKYQSSQLLQNKESLSEYLTLLSSSIKKELLDFEFYSDSRVLFIGSGAFPLSALTIARETGAEVLCLDVDEEAVNLGGKIAEIAGLRNRIRFSGSYVEGLHYALKSTHIFIASLVGNKCEVLEKLKPAISPETSIILRYGNGIKSIFNYPLAIDVGNEWEKKWFTRNDCIYDTLVLKAKLTLEKVAREQ